MATQTEVEGETTVSLPPDFEAGLASEQEGQNDIAPQMGQNQTQSETETVGEQLAQPQEDTSDETDMSDREERRVSKLIPKLKGETEARKKAESEASALRQLLEQMRTGEADTPGFGTPPWEKPMVPVPPTGEVSPEQYQQHIIGAADQIASLKGRQTETKVMQYLDLRDDTTYVRGKYPALNPESENYSEDMEKTIAGLYETASKADSKLRLKEFVDRVMSLHQAGQTVGQRTATQTVARHVAEGAIPPSASGQSKGRSTDPGSMSAAEMEAYLKETGEWDNA